MGANKIVMNTPNGENVLIDLTGDSVTPADLVEGVTAHGADGEPITGNVETVESTTGVTYIMPGSGVSLGETTNNITVERAQPKDTLYRKGVTHQYLLDKTAFGDASPADVAKGKTFTSTSGLKVVGTAEGGGSDNVDSSRYVETPFGQEFFYEVGGTETVCGEEHLLLNHIEYLESDSLQSQRIDTGIRSTSDISYEIKYTPTGGGSTKWMFQCIIGCTDYSNSFYPICLDPSSNVATGEYIAYSHNGVQWGHLGEDLTNVPTVLRKEGLRFTLTADNGFSTTLTHPGTGESFPTDKNLFIFAKDTSVDFCSAKLYYCKIWDNGVLVRDFIPAIDTLEKPCLYDKVSRTCFYNGGSGSFVAGEITEVNAQNTVYTGATGLIGVLEKLDELGAFVSVKTTNSGTETFKDCHVSENCFLRCGVPNSGNSGNRWLDIKNGESVTIPIYLSTSSSNSQDWEIVQFDTGYYVYIYGNYAPTYFFIGDTVDPWGNVKKGIATYERGSSSYAIVGTDSIHHGETTQSLSFTAGATNTKLSPVYSINGYEKFKDVFFLSHAPNTQERSLEINGVCFYVDKWGKIAIRYNK